MKDTTLPPIRIELELKAHLEKKAKSLKMPLSEYIRRGMKKISGFKEPPIV